MFRTLARRDDGRIEGKKSLEKFYKLFYLDLKEAINRRVIVR
jgi:hypothetical protein